MNYSNKNNILSSLKISFLKKFKNDNIMIIFIKKLIILYMESIYLKLVEVTCLFLTNNTFNNNKKGITVLKTGRAYM